MNQVPLMVQLHITNACNLKCRYCYEIHKGNNYMPLEVAKEAISKYMSFDDGSEKVIIDLIGGEPLIAFDMIKDLMQFASEEAKNWKKDCVFFATTNGTLLDEEKKKWLFEHKDKIVLGLSLDGTKTAHDYNRSGSYDMVAKHFSFFRDTWPSQWVKMTIGPGSIDQVYEGILNIYNNGFRCAANVVMEDVWGNSKEEYLRVFESQLERLVEYFSNHRELEPPILICLPIESLVIMEDKNKPWCGSGISMVAIDMEGIEYPCHRFISTSNTRKYDPSLIAKSPRKISACDNCPFLLVCQSCNANNWETNSHPNSRTSFHCEFTKLQILATVRLKFNYILQELSQMPSSLEDSERLKDILVTTQAISYVYSHRDSLT
ncbi:MAG: radical SAM protein [Methanotrichaceae archaeon]|nr:radical SAM protein [Methanotrichaceae archaeon]